MNRVTDAAFYGGLIGFLLGMAVGLVLWSSLEAKEQRRMAVEAGAGYWSIDVRTGDSAFKYGCLKCNGIEVEVKK